MADSNPGSLYNTLYPQRGGGTNTYSWGQKIDPSFSTGDQFQPYANVDTTGMDFGKPPSPDAKPQINPFTGEFMGWSGPNGSTWIPTSTYSTGMNGAYGQFADKIRGQNLGQSGDWTLTNGGAKEAPAAFQHGPNNMMERLASYSPYIIAAMAAGGGGMAASGMTAAEASAAVSGGTAATGAAAADTSLGVGSTVLGDVTPAAGTMGYGATPGIEGTIAGSTGAGSTSIMGDVGPAGTQPGYGAVPDQPWYQTAYDYAKTANEYKGYYDKAKTAYNMMNPPEQSFQHYNEGYDDLSGSPSGQTPDFTPNTDGVPRAGGYTPFEGNYPQQGGGAGWDRYAKVGGSLADMAAAYYSAQQQKDLAGNQKAPFSAMQGKQDEYNKLLMASYYNPDTFYNSNQWKGLSSVYGNKLDRNAGNVGRLANDADRAVMMQKYGMNELENYRTGLRGNINAYDPSKLAGMYGEGLKSEAGANTAPFAAASKGGPTASQVQGYVNTAKSAYEIWQGVSKWFA